MRSLIASGALCLIATTASPVLAQHAELSGRVTDPSDAVVPGATVIVLNQAKGLKRTITTNTSGVYVAPLLQPGVYVITVQAAGFQTVARSDVVLEVDQRAELNLTLPVGNIEDEVTVQGGTGRLLGSTDGSVSTVIDRRFAASLPIRGRSFSALVSMAPGVAVAPGRLSSTYTSEFHVGGQRESANSLTIDGVSAVSEMDAAGLTNASGQRFGSTVTGTVNGGVSMDALQEIRVQTSSFAPEFGRTPGAQISVLTRSGSNELTGSAFEQFRNEALSANDWFANSRGLEKSALDEHQFGAAVGGPLIRNRTFFFGSYEGLRLTRPDVSIRNVPSREARERDSPARAILNLYPVPTGPDRPDLTAEYVHNHPIYDSSDTWSIRGDHVLSPGVQIFGRYAQTPSSNESVAPKQRFAMEKRTQSVTAGMTAALRSKMLLDIRASYAESDYSVGYTLPGMREWFPATVPDDAYLIVGADLFANLDDGRASGNRQRQINIVGFLSYVGGAHHVKVGVDHRQMRPAVQTSHLIYVYLQDLTGERAREVTTTREVPVHAVYPNTSVYAQDTWKILPQLSVTYGLRWDVNPPPSFREGEGPLSVATFEPLSELALSPTRNVPLWETNYDNIFPRAGFSYALGADGRTVLSGGAGLFGDLEGSTVDVSVGTSSRAARVDVAFPLSADDVFVSGTPSIEPPYGYAHVVDPQLETPRTTHWNLGVERALGTAQAASVTYVGARGEGLFQSRYHSPGTNPDFKDLLNIVSAEGRSRYHALQLQYRRRAATGLHVLTSYTLSDAKDTSSSISRIGRTTDQLSPTEADVRHLFKLALSWTIPSVTRGPFAWALRDWGLHAVGTARSGYPFSVQSSLGFSDTPGGERTLVTATALPGVPTILNDPTAPGGQRLNPAAFVDPPPGEQGNTTRNAFRGFASYQVDLGVQRAFPLVPGTTLQIRVDAFNLLNTPAFALPCAHLSCGDLFGIPNQLVASASGGLYRAGGPRNIAVSARVEF